MLKEGVQRCSSAPPVFAAACNQAGGSCRERGAGSGAAGHGVRSALIMMSISDGSVLAVLAESECDLGLVAYEMTLLGNQAGTMLSPLARGLR